MRGRSLTIVCALVAGLAQGAYALTPDRCLQIWGWMQGEDWDLSAFISSFDPPKCGSSLGLSGARSVHCSWPFAYRAPQAREKFEALVAELAFCFEAEASEDDQVVNHPDSYDLREFELEGGVISASLKDKGALQQTYIFLRAERQPD